MMASLIERTESIEVILKVTERCNINCTYCYMFNKGNDDYLSRPVAVSSAWIDEVVKFLEDGIQSMGASRVNVVFHGGEPLMLKKGRFRELCGKLRAALDGRVALSLGMQTNAILVDPEWIDLFVEYRVDVGISLDGPARLNDRYRVDKRGRGTHAGTLKGMALLRDAYNEGRIAKPGVICVINPEHDPREIYRHIVDELGVDNMSFNLPMETCDTISPADQDAIARYLVGLFDEWVSDDDPRITIRIFDNMLRFFAGDEPFRALLPNFLTRHVMVVIASDGTLSEHDDFKVINFAQRVGSLKDTTLYQFANSPLRRYLDVVAQTVPDGCRDCEWKGYCRAGVTHGLTVSRYSKANGFNNRSSLCHAFQSLFRTGSEYLMKNGLPEARLRQSLAFEDPGLEQNVRALRSVPEELFS